MAQGVELIPIAQAVVEFGVNRVTVHRWLAAGKVTRHERQGGRPRVFVDRREIRRLLEPRAVRRKK